jgi:LmbE family N-acetylglucosaminyl deacetylase
VVKFVRYRRLFRLYEFIQPFLKYSLVVENQLPGENVLVIAPHPDDEVIGCGGTLRRHADAGGSIDILYCTMDTEDRRKESADAARLLGARSREYLDFPVESLHNRCDLAVRFADIIAHKKPDIVFLPFWFDNHTDHRAVNEALLSAATNRKFGFLVYAYPVWFPLYPNVLSDIGTVWERKKDMIRCYQSQLATRDYIKMSESLGRYWAAVKGHGLDMVESFFRASVEEYITLGKKIIANGK